jgi:protein TonB
MKMQPETFRWQVSMVEPPAPQSAEMPPAAPQTPAPPQKSVRPNSSARTASQAKHHSINTEHLTKVIQRTPVVRQEVREAEPVARSEALPAPTVYSQPTPIHEVEPISQNAETSSIPSESITSTVTSQLPGLTEVPAAVSQELVEETRSTVVEHMPMSKQSVTMVETPVAESVPTRVEREIIEATSSIQPSSRTPAVTAPVQGAAIQNAPPQAIFSTKADYTWLIEDLWSRVEQFKRYPYIARTNRWEGMVVLQAVINNEGQLLDLKVAESSGYLVLDQDAMDVMRKSCPLHLKHPLGKPHVVVDVPINYKIH